MVARAILGSYLSFMAPYPDPQLEDLSPEEIVASLIDLYWQAHGVRVMQGMLGSDGLQLPGIDTRLRVWYNPELDNVNFMVPALVGMILQMMCSNLTAAAIVRERERGTMEQLNITPIRSLELVVGKAIPYLGIATLDAAEILSAGVFWFNLEIHGSMPLTNPPLGCTIVVSDYSLIIMSC